MVALQIKHVCLLWACLLFCSLGVMATPLCTETCTLVIVEYSKLHRDIDGQLLSYHRVEKRWKDSFCRLDGLPFPREYRGKKLQGRHRESYTCIGEGDSFTYIEYTIGIFELKPGRHVILLPDENGDYPVQHEEGKTGVSIRTSSRASYVFSLQPKELRILQHDGKRIKAMDSFRDMFPALKEREKVAYMWGVDILSRIVSDHHAGKRGSQILPEYMP